MPELSAYPAFRQTPDHLMLFVSEHLCYSWECQGIPAELIMRRYSGAPVVAAIEYKSVEITEEQFRVAAHEKLDEALDYITKMAT